MKRLAILLGIVIFAALSAQAEGENPNLTTLGEGTVTVPADTVTISVSVQSNNENMTLAQNEVQEKMDQAIDALKAAGVKDEEILPGQASGVTNIQSSSRTCKIVNNTTVCENITQRVSALKKTTIVRLKTMDESRINSVVNAAKSTGASADVEGYGLGDTSAAAAQARQKAVDNAKENAEGMATAAGGRLGNLVDISDYALPYVSSSDQPGMVDVTSYVVITYEIAM
jgi:uncharacterized protein YggE